MIVETSALVAVLRDEPDAAEFAELIANATERRMSAASYVEVGAVIDGARDPVISRRFDEFLAEAQIEIMPVSNHQAQIVREAYRDFGRGSGHPAKLNFGDCFSYALASERGEPLLFKGDDFIHTDIESSRRRPVNPG